MRTIQQYYDFCYLRHLLILALVLIPPSINATEIMFIKLSQPQSDIDNRSQYVHQLLINALEITKETFGPYKVEYSESSMSPLREQVMLSRGEQINLSWLPVTQTLDFSDAITPVPIPLLKGLLGYRVFLIHINNREKFSSLNSLEEFKQLTVGQREGWGDISIFKYNDIVVSEGNNYEGLFAMTHANRFDYFSRGVSEAPVEYETRKHQYPNLWLEEDVLLFYPYPVFFFTNKNNVRLSKRLHLGLETMIQNGSFDALFFKHHQALIEQAKLKGRKLFKLETPNIPSYVPLNNPELWFNPIE